MPDVLRSALPLLVALAGLPANAASLFQDGLEDATEAPVAWLSDEFDEPASLADFSRVWRREHWPFDQLQVQVIGQVPGRLTMQPHSSGWYEDYRGELSYKELSGDLVATTLVYPRNRAGTGAPGSTQGGALGSEYSLAGLMLRAPRREVEAANANWVRGREAYVFLSMGAAHDPGVYQFEDKSTRPAPAPGGNSISTLLVTNAPAGANAAYLRLVRIDAHVLLLVQPVGGVGSGWQVLRRFNRSDFPERLQLGFVTYTDWATMQGCSYEFHNSNILAQSCGPNPQPADPDLNASFEFLRVDRPQVPAPFAGADFSNPAAVSDAQILALFGFAP
ncbi:MAG: hypothetical protein IPK27_15550 [Rhodanobacteraceae bacterium]|nr:hypothetical protein [Rhodanobacteraceae bacterium]